MSFDHLGLRVGIWGQGLISDYSLTWIFFF